jgi:hypothetical protein
VDISTSTIDDVESIEVYGVARLGMNANASRITRRNGTGGQMATPSSHTPLVPISNAERANSEIQGRFCPTAVYVWMR